MSAATLWLLDQAWPAAIEGLDDAQAWLAADGTWMRAYAATPRPGWQALQPLRTIAGASAGEAALHHYVVETSVAPEHEAELNAWYDEEHLAGLAAVPGTVHAARWKRLGGRPSYLACYDLVTPTALQRPEWLAVRHTAWSARVRPWFVEPRRTLFTALLRAAGPASPAPHGRNS